jgi:hypothetical protein
VLKSSDFVIHDLNKAYESIADTDNKNEKKRVLILRQWLNIRPSMEFRCFVKNKKMLGLFNVITECDNV